MNKFTIILLCFSLLLLQSCKSILETKKLTHDYLHKIKDVEQIDSYFTEVKEINDLLKKQRNEWYLIDAGCEDDKEGDQDQECLLDRVVVTGTHIKATDLITNNQVAGVDEGDIIKFYNEILVILRKGKLYSINIGDVYSQELIKIDEINAFSPDWEHDAYFDEILIDEGVILVLGYNYDYDSSEIIRFEISDAGNFKYLDNYLIKSGDYYDDENYASRLFNHQYTTYIPIELYTNIPFSEQLPKIAKVPKGFHWAEKDLSWENLIDVDDIYYPIQSVLDPVLHSFITCPLNKQELYCDAVGIIGSSSNLSYNNSENVYLWVSAWESKAFYNKDINIDSTLYDYKTEYREADEEFENVDLLYNPMVYKVSLIDLSVEAIQVTGMPVSQFSFHHYENNLYMYSVVDKDTAQLLKMPEYMFNKQASNSSIKLRTLKNIPAFTSTERFIGKQLFLGSGLWEFEEFPMLTTVNIKSGRIKKLKLGHSTNRIESINNLALIVGQTTDKNLGISLLDINELNDIKQTYIFDRLEGESRSHAFNFKYIDDFLLTGLTTQSKKKAEIESYGEVIDYYWDDDVSSDITFIGGKDGDFEYIGELVSESQPKKECKFSCDDWYGNSRPFFIGERIFALSGDELIEAGLLDDEIVEIIRIKITEN